MRLDAYPPKIISPELTTVLEEKLGIKTDIEFLFSSTPLEILHRLPAGTLSLGAIEKYVAQIAEATSAKGISAADILLSASSEPQAYSLRSHCSDLDEILGGNGFIASNVYEITGDRRCGKTILALNVALHLLLDDPASEAVWIDTTGDFSSDLAVGIVEDEQFPSTKPVHDRFAALDRLQVATAIDTESVHHILEVLSKGLRTKGSQHPRTKSIVIDTITPLVGPYLSPTSSQGHAIMSSFMKHLQSIARIHSVTIFVINNATVVHGPQTNAISMFAPAENKKPSLGASFPYLTDATLWLSKRRPETDADDTSVVEVLRSRVSVSQSWCKVKFIRGAMVNIT